MSIHAIGSSGQHPAARPDVSIDTNQKKPAALSEANQLNDEIVQAESEMKETAKEVQKAAGESSGGSSERVQLLQNKMQMQQQAILMKQLKLKEIESSLQATDQQAPADPVTRPRFDRFVAGEDASGKPDNVYRLEEKDGKRTVLFSRAEV